MTALGTQSASFSDCLKLHCYLCTDIDQRPDPCGVQVEMAEDSTMKSHLLQEETAHLLKQAQSELESSKQTVESLNVKLANAQEQSQVTSPGRARPPLSLCERMFHCEWP